ncbi:hypothetical protein D7V94_05530 [Parablautia intestinalis]|jgi:hypothetical protein|uniref:Nucleoside kinase n=1 Tax=Parablautia intestinalis TaxID=2320100 RepID=A0A3A9B037_9FIRM|nr:AAA family ATPase [Parablautia intestinalis]MCI8614467.1 hypothetical protein [Lachnospiraceae bacterium]RKI92786.1 hypothetical protein D7V94_05530 [Parablautia intestinalis]
MKPTNKQPLFIITGASCVGKSTLCEQLFLHEKDYIVMESDLLWNDMYNTPEDDYCAYRRLWMRMCANISQIGKPVVLCGCAIPKQFENQPEREMFSDIYYLAAVCGDEVLEDRMRNGRKVNEEGWIKSSLDFNNWLKQNADKTSPRITLLDTTNLSPSQAAGIADSWILEKIV